MRIGFSALLAAAAFAGLCTGAQAATGIPYPGSGSYNPVTYSFTAVASGDLKAYFVGGASAGFENQVGVLINGVLSSAGYGLDNHASAVGDSFNFGHVDAGDALTFVLYNLSLSSYAYSDPALNGSYDTAAATGHNHIYSTFYDGTDASLTGVPAGVYVAFEDLPFPGSDFNYNDESFVFTNVSVSPTGVPEPASWALMVLGFGAAGATLRARRKPIVSFS